jgi:hypothetical protein
MSTRYRTRQIVGVLEEPAMEDAPTVEQQPDREDTPTLEQQPEGEDVAAGPTIVGQLLPDQPIPTEKELRRHRRRHLARQRVRENRQEMP